MSGHLARANRRGGVVNHPGKWLGGDSTSETASYRSPKSMKGNVAERMPYMDPGLGFGFRVLSLGLEFGSWA